MVHRHSPEAASRRRQRVARRGFLRIWVQSCSSHPFAAASDDSKLADSIVDALLSDPWLPAYVDTSSSSFVDFSPLPQPSDATLGDLSFAIATSSLPIPESRLDHSHGGRTAARKPLRDPCTLDDTFLEREYAFGLLTASFWRLHHSCVDEFWVDIENYMSDTSCLDRDWCHFDVSISSPPSNNEAENHGRLFDFDTELSLELPTPPENSCMIEVSLLVAYRAAVSDPKKVFREPAFTAISDVAREAGYQDYCARLGVHFTEDFLHQACERLRHHAACVHPDYDGDPPLEDQTAVKYSSDCFAQVRSDFERLQEQGYV